MSTNGVITRGPSFVAPALPQSAEWRCQLLDAVILAAAIVARAAPPVHPAVKMVLLTETRLCGLAGSPFGIDVIARFESWLRLTADPRAARRLLAQHMNRFVGTPWAPIILRVAEVVAAGADPHRVNRPDASLAALKNLRISLGICRATECGAHA